MALGRVKRRKKVPLVEGTVVGNVLCRRWATNINMIDLWIFVSVLTP